MSPGRITLPRRALLAAGPLVLLPQPGRADAARLRIARQFGLGYAQMALLEDGRLIEKHAAAAGLGAVEITWSTFRSSDVMNDALLSGGLDIASLGVPGLLTVADRTAGTRFEVKGLCGFNVAPIALVTREPTVRSITDYRPGMRIAVPAAKVSNQAIYLQMAAAKQWGMAEFTRLDPLTTSMSHPDAAAALLSGGSEITSHFGAPPFTQRELKAPGAHEVTNSTAILGQPASFNLLGMPTRFFEGNPGLVHAVLAALDEATAAVNADKPAAAATYARLTNDRTPLPDLIEAMTGAMGYTLGTTGTLPIARFMAAAGTLKRSPGSWTDYMHPSAVPYGGS